MSKPSICIKPQELRGSEFNEPNLVFIEPKVYKPKK